MTPDVALRARLQQQPLLAQFAGEIGDARGAKGRDGAIRLAIGQVDHRQACRHLRARRAFQPLVDLILQQFAGLIEQIDRDQPVREAADHFVAAPPDRRQFAIFVEQAERVDRRKVVALRPQEQICANSADATSCPCRAISELGASRFAIRTAAKQSP